MSWVKVAIPQSLGGKLPRKEIRRGEEEVFKKTPFLDKASLKVPLKSPVSNLYRENYQGVRFGKNLAQD